MWLTPHAKQKSGSVETARYRCIVPEPDPSYDHYCQAMGEALAEAHQAEVKGDVPVGAVVMVDGEIVARAHNEREASGDPTAHAEVLAIRRAAEAVGGRRLHDATLVVTLEPCLMCAGAIWAAQVGTVVFGAADLKAGATGSLYNFAVDPRLNHMTKVVHGVRAEESAQLLTDFFAARRPLPAVTSNTGVAGSVGGRSVRTSGS